MRAIVLGVLVLSIGMVGCEDKENIAAKGNEKSSLDPDVVNTEEQILAQGDHPEDTVLRNAQGRWEALISRDFQKAYGFISPGMKSVIPYETYLKREAAKPLLWQKVDSAAASCDNLDVCQVSYTLSYAYTGLLEAARGEILQSQMKEKWLLIDGQWWFVPPA